MKWKTTSFSIVHLIHSFNMTPKKTLTFVTAIAIFVLLGFVGRNMMALDNSSKETRQMYKELQNDGQ